MSDTLTIYIPEEMKKEIYEIANTRKMFDKRGQPSKSAVIKLAVENLIRDLKADGAKTNGVSNGDWKTAAMTMLNRHDKEIGETLAIVQRHDERIENIKNAVESMSVAMGSMKKVMEMMIENA